MATCKRVQVECAGPHFPGGLAHLGRAMRGHGGMLLRTPLRSATRSEQGNGAHTVAKRPSLSGKLR